MTEEHQGAETTDVCIPLIREYFTLFIVCEILSFPSFQYITRHQPVAISHSLDNAQAVLLAHILDTAVSQQTVWQVTLEGHGFLILHRLFPDYTSGKHLISQCLCFLNL